MDRVTTLAAGFIASPYGPKEPKKRMKWAYEQARNMALMRCDVLGHDLRYVYDRASSTEYYRCNYCMHEEDVKNGG